MSDLPQLPASLVALKLQTSPETTRAYAELTADLNPIHLDARFAANTAFGRPILHGTMALNLILEAAARTFGRARPVTGLAIRFLKPVPVGETIQAFGTLTSSDADADADAGTYAVWVETQTGLRALEGTLTIER